MVPYTVCNPRLCSTVVVLLFALLLCQILFISSQVADPVRPYYSYDQVVKQFKNFPVPDHATVPIMSQRKALEARDDICLNHADRPGDVINSWRGIPIDEDVPGVVVPILRNTTYWFNEFLHVGHVHYDIVLMQVLQTEKVDRIVMQRAACNARQCIGIGSIDSFYKGYFAALFKAFNQPNIPVYLRWTWKEKSVSPIYFSADTPDYYNTTAGSSSIELKNLMCFDRVIRRARADYGQTPLVSSSAVQAFKQAAYAMVNDHRSVNSTSHNLTTYFTDKPPYRILFAYRSTSATRYINNMQAVVEKLKIAFPSPHYHLRLLDTSDINLDFTTQLQAVAESNVVICNHGAFEANMIYMRNASLLIEIFGHYGNNEIHTFHRLALVFGLYYARVHPRDMIDHLQPNFTMAAEDIEEIVGMTTDYFGHKRYLRNVNDNHHQEAKTKFQQGQF